MRDSKEEYTINMILRTAILASLATSMFWAGAYTYVTKGQIARGELVCESIKDTTVRYDPREYEDGR